ncbi:MAG: glycosyltransferase family 4 protein [Anaerolineaceae bacterium]|nr:glycosyltransferase family 4 protein [Anaerolineaceae bacterium]
MKVLMLYDYPASPSGLATQAELLYQGLKEEGVEVFPVNSESATEKEWYYRWFKPDIVVGVGYWGHSPHIIQHPLQHGMLPVPWLVADGYIANYRDVLNALPLILVTSNWVKEVYMRDGIRGDTISVLPVGCDIERFTPRAFDDPRIREIRQRLNVHPDQLMILTAGGDAASKGAQEVMQALSFLGNQVPSWEYICKVWPQPRTFIQNAQDVELARRLGIFERVHLITDIVSRNFMPFLINACDVYAAPSRLEGFGMSQVEAGACGKPVVSIHAMGMLDTLIQDRTAFMAQVAEEHRVSQVVLGPESGYEPGYTVKFDPPRIVDYRANVQDLARYLEMLMLDPALRERMGLEARRWVAEQFDYRVIARRFLKTIQEKLNIC